MVGCLLYLSANGRCLSANSLHTAACIMQGIYCCLQSCLFILHIHVYFGSHHLQICMSTKRKMLWLIFLFPPLIAAVLWRANQYPKGYYGNPLDIPVELAANFGEVRVDHFHMGLDIRTNGREN